MFDPPLFKTLQGIILILAITLVGVIGGYAQCVEHPQGRTAIRFNNESSYRVAFYIDDSDDIILEPKTMTPPLEVGPGEHFFKAMTFIGGKAVWVTMQNEVPRGYICTWSVLDPERDEKAQRDLFQSYFPPRSERRTNE